jgi:CHAD domain-containing protein
MAKARDVPLTGELSFREAAGLTVSVRAREVFERAEGVLDVSDIERVHDMRVATRRLRAVLEIFAKCFPRDEHRAALRDVKALADALGERRDRDVAIDSLERTAAALSAEDRAGIEHLIRTLRAEQQAANTALARCIASYEEAGLEERLVALAASAGVATEVGG